MGAHATYPTKFFKIALEILENNEADAVGGPLIQMGRTWKGSIIAACMSTKWGVGGTEFRTSSKRQYVQSVAFAVYNKNVFEKAGLLDEDLIRNQDDEFHYRLNHLGFRILMVPELACTYYVRESLKGLWKQYYGYGLYKPLVLKKVKSSVRLRHIVPALFVIYWIFAFVLWWLWPILCVPGILYVILNTIFSVKVGKGSLQSMLYAFLVFPTLHFAYGLGFIKGFIQPPFISKKIVNR
jgi:GT2 family glycosyltransferase